MAEESRFAYKNIEEVMDNQQDLVVPVKRLKTIGVVKRIEGRGSMPGQGKNKQAPVRGTGGLPYINIGSLP